MTPRSEDGRIRLLIVTQFLDRGGLEEVVKTLVRRLCPDQYVIAVAYAKGGRAAAELEAEHHVKLIAYDAPGRWARFQKLYRAARDFHPDIVHTHFSWYGPVAGLLTGAMRVETIHNLYDWFRGPLRLWYGLHLLLNHKIVAVSRHVAGFSRKQFFFLPHRRMVVIANGVDLPQERPPLPGQGTRERGALTIGFVGRLSPLKGVEFLLRAAALLKVRGMIVHIRVAGDGPEEERLRSMASELGGVEFAGYQSDVQAFLRWCDLFVLPSVLEGMPLSVIEAMAAGLPVVAASVGGVPEVVEDRVTGILVPPRDPGALASAIEELAGDRELRFRMGKNGQDRAYSLFSADRMVRETDLLYRALLKRPELHS